jgi:hypothetical protein
MSKSTATNPQLRLLPAVDQREVEPSPSFDQDLSLELGLSVWMQHHAIADDDCHSAMLAIRAALLEVAGMDARSEPVPLHGRSPEVDIANFAAYLADLFVRASAAVECELPHVIGRVSEHLAS